MATQKIQIHFRLFAAFGLGILIASCARDLRSESELDALPDQFQVAMKQAEVPVEEEGEENSEEAAGDKAASPSAKGNVQTEQSSPAVGGDARLREKTAPQTGSVGTKKGAADSKAASGLRKDKSSTDKELKPGAKTDTASGKTAPPPPVKAFVPAAWPFGIGESFDIRFKYGVIDGGTATLSVVEATELNGEKLLHIRGEVKSSKLVNMFYKVDNSFDSYVTLKNFLPVRQVIRQNESARWGRSILTFDYKKKEAHYYQNIERHKKSKQVVDRKVSPFPGAQDLFGALYFYRFLPMANNYRFPIQDKWKGWNTEMEFIKKEEIKVAAGKFKTIRYKVIPRLDGMLKSKAKVEVWISDDDRRLLVKFTSKLKMGSLTGELEKYKDGNNILLPPPELLTPFNL